MRILQIKTTPIANAPDLLSDAINKYTNHYSVVQSPLDKVDGKFDVVIFHNKYFSTKGFDKELIMYHSEPFMVDLYVPKHVTKMVIAQYHATLREFKDCNIVRNIIDFNSDLYKLKHIDKIKIGYSPSNKGSFGMWHNKGYEETKKILEEIKSIYKDKIDYDIITDVSLEECLRRKSECNILIDEVVTGSYHRSGLEGLALGKCTICGISPEVSDVLENITNDINPFYQSSIYTLKDDLCCMIDNIPVNDINYFGDNNRKWMEKNWSPEIIINEFLKLIEK